MHFKGKSRILLVFLMVLTFLAVTFGPSYAANVNDLLKEKKQKQSQIKETKTIIKTQQKKRKRFIG